MRCTVETDSLCRVRRGTSASIGGSRVRGRVNTRRLELECQSSLNALLYPRGVNMGCGASVLLSVAVGGRTLVVEAEDRTIQTGAAPDNVLDIQ
jgi:hypothetical protein